MAVEKNLKSAIIERKDFKARQPMKKNKKVIYGYISEKCTVDDIFYWARLMPGVSGSLRIKSYGIEESFGSINGDGKKIRITIEEVSK